MKRIYQAEFDHLDRQIQSLLLKASQSGDRDGPSISAELRMMVYDLAKTQKRMLKLMERMA